MSHDSAVVAAAAGLYAAGLGEAVERFQAETKIGTREREHTALSRLEDRLQSAASTYLGLAPLLSDSDATRLREHMARTTRDLLVAAYSSTLARRTA